MGTERCRRVRRADPRRIAIGPPDRGLTGYGGLAGFGSFVRDLGVDGTLREAFGHLKSGLMVVYPDGGAASAPHGRGGVGEHRVFGVEALSADPLFVHLCGGVVPSLDTLYRDLRRFDDPAIAALEAMIGNADQEARDDGREKRGGRVVGPRGLLGEAELA